MHSIKEVADAAEMIRSRSSKVFCEKRWRNNNRG